MIFPVEVGQKFVSMQRTGVRDGPRVVVPAELEQRQSQETRGGEG